MHPPSKEEKQLVKELLAKQLGYTPSESEILECYQSLMYFAKAKHRYLLLKKGLLSKKKFVTVSK